MLLFPTVGKTQFVMDYQYLYNSPLAQMPTLNNAHGLGFAAYGAVKKSNYYVGINVRTGIYGYHTEPIDFMDTEGNNVKTNLNITNSYNSWAIYNRYNFGKFSEGHLLPFVEASAGWSFFRTKLYIEDPLDETNCEPLEKDIMQRDNTWSVYAGAGFGLKLTGLFNKSKVDYPVKTYFTLSFGYNYGGKVSYMNVDADEASHIHHNGTSSTNEGKQDFYTSWYNTSTQVTHEHHTGYLFTSPVRMMEIKAGFSIKF